MKIIFFHDGPVILDENGRPHRGFLTEEIISRYFALGDEIIIATRHKKQDDLPDSTIMNIDHVAFEEIPDFKSIKGYLKNKKYAIQRINALVREADVVIARIPSSIGSLAAKCSKENKKPYMVEVVGDPWESLRHHSKKGAVLAPYAMLRMKRIVAEAPYAIYVTEKYLQRRYPTKGKGVGISDVILPEEESNVLDNRIDRINSLGVEITLGTLGVVHIKYKGQQHVIRALGKLKREGLCNYRYVLAGPGDQTYLRTVAKENDVEDQVVFLGALPHNEALKWLESVDIYLQPSETEGMPRALIEAMSKGCLCIGSNVGGIPELIDSSFIFTFDEKPEEQIYSLLKSVTVGIMMEEANKNYNKARLFRHEVLKEKRLEYYKKFLRENGLE